MIAGDRDRIEFRHVLRRVFDDVGDDAHRGSGRIDVGVPDHELFEDVVLDRAGELVLRDALFLGGDDEAGEHRQHRAVHGHRHAHLVERDAVEQDLHVLDGVDRDAGLADIADDARMVAVIAAMRRQIERHRQAHLPALQALAVKLVRVLRGGEAGILPDGPGPVGVHGGARPAQKRRKAGHAAQRLEMFEIGRGIERLHRDALGRRPGQLVERRAAQLLLRELAPIFERFRRKLGHCAILARRARRRLVASNSC